MAKQRQGVSSIVLLLFFLLLVCSFTTGLLYLELRHKNALLEEKIAELEKSQVLLMVPDEQAQALADWMESNPEFTQSLLKQAEPGAEVRVQIGPEEAEAPEAIALTATEVQPNLSPLLPMEDAEQASNEIKAPQKVVSAANNGDQDSQTPPQAVKLSENKDGVKVISLPHGGIRVTTREDN